jgi:hypothetical protein
MSPPGATLSPGCLRTPQLPEEIATMDEPVDLSSTIIYRNQRAAYLRALRRADQGEPGALGELIARAILDNLDKFVVPAVAEVLR